MIEIKMLIRPKKWMQFSLEIFEYLKKLDNHSPHFGEVSFLLLYLLANIECKIKYDYFSYDWWVKPSSSF